MNELQQIKITVNQNNEQSFPKCQNGLGHVYIIKSDDCVKIGISTDVAKRIRSIRTQSGRNIDRVFVSESCSNYYSVEAKLHRHFKDKRLHGEWFKVDFESVVHELKSLNLERSVSVKCESALLLVESFRNAEEQFYLNNVFAGCPTIKAILDYYGCRAYINKDKIYATNEDGIDAPVEEIVRYFAKQEHCA
jgi:hypothetical protein